MLVVGAFEHSLELEQALNELEHNGVPRSSILIVPMDTDPDTTYQFVSKRDDLHYKGIEVGIACATAFAVVGTSVGFVLAWGPIVWGLISALAGFIIGFGVIFLTKKKNYRQLPKKLPEITVIIQCPKNQSPAVMKILWKYPVLSVGRVTEPS